MIGDCIPATGLQQIQLSILSRPSQLAAGSALEFSAQQIRICVSPWIAQPDPGEVKNLMNQNARQLGRLVGKVLLQHDGPPRDIRSGVDGLSARFPRIQFAAMNNQGPLEANRWRSVHERRFPYWGTQAAQFKFMTDDFVLGNT